MTDDGVYLSISPNPPCKGQDVEITWTGPAPAPTVTVTIDGVATDYEFDSDNKVSVPVPDGATTFNASAPGSNGISRAPADC